MSIEPVCAVAALVVALANEAGEMSGGSLTQKVWEKGAESMVTLLSTLLAALLTYLLVTRRAERQRHQLEIEKSRLEFALAQKKKEVEIARALAAEYDKDLRERRIEAYSRLWKELEPFALYSPKADLKYGDLVGLGQRLRAWYFEEGGLLLSTKARSRYFAVQDALVQVQTRTPGPRTRLMRGRSDQFTQSEVERLGRDLPQQWVPGDEPRLDFLELRRRTSELRTSLCEDVGTRKAPLLEEQAPAAREASESLNAPLLDEHTPAVVH